MKYAADIGKVTHDLCNFDGTGGVMNQRIAAFPTVKK